MFSLEDEKTVVYKGGILPAIYPFFSPQQHHTTTTYILSDIHTRSFEMFNKLSFFAVALAALPLALAGSPVYENPYSKELPIPDTKVPTA